MKRDVLVHESARRREAESGKPGGSWNQYVCICLQYYKMQDRNRIDETRVRHITVSLLFTILKRFNFVRY